MAGEDPLWPAAKQPSRFHLCVPFTETGFRTRQHPYGTLVYSPNTAELIVNLMNPDLAEQDYSYSVKVMAQNLPVVSGPSCFSMRMMLLFFSFFDWPAFDCFFGRTFQMNEEERRHHYMRLEGYKEHTHRVVKDQCSRRGFDIVEFHQPRDAQAYLRDHQFNTVKDRQVRVSIVGCLFVHSFFLDLAFAVYPDFSILQLCLLHPTSRHGRTRLTLEGLQKAFDPIWLYRAFRTYGEIVFTRVELGEPGESFLRGSCNIPLDFLRESWATVCGNF